MKEFETQEYEYCKRVFVDIDNKISQLREEKQELKKQVITERINMWQENRHLIRDFDDVVMLSSQDVDVATNEKLYLQNEQAINKLIKQRRSPYFGRVDFYRTEREETSTIYIGLYSLKKNDSFKFYVVDWRAPISSLYYNYGVGVGEYEVAGIEHKVHISLKRQFKFEDGQLSLIFDTDSAVFDEILGKILAENTTNNLKVIVSSIQKEQNAAIRYNMSQSCLIYGLAGSGKTSVGLHRLAYILYNNRECITSENIIIISNNNIFCSYISRILPDLGEEPVNTMVFQDILSEHFSGEHNIENYYEYALAAEAQMDKHRSELMTIKNSYEFLTFCYEYFSSFSFQIPEIKYRGEIIISQKGFQERCQYAQKDSFKANYDMVTQYLQQTIEDYFLNNKERICQDIEDNNEEYLSVKEVNAIFRKKRKKLKDATLQELIKINELWADRQAQKVLSIYLKRIEKCQKADSQLLTTKCETILYEDAILLLFIKILMGEVKTNSKVKHVVIDEAQDYSMMQLSILKNLFPQSTFTLLADTYQAINFATSIMNHNSFEQVFDEKLVQLHMRKCYRSSREINLLAFHIIGHEVPSLLKEHTYFDRAVQKPQYIITNNSVKSVRSILKEQGQYNTIAVIVNNEAEVVSISQQLQARFDVQTILSPNDRLNNRIIIIPLLLAKGLEFDVVILVNIISKNKQQLNFFRKAYLACTRALHKLFLIENEPVPSVIQDCLSYLEVKEVNESEE